MAVQELRRQVRAVSDSKIPWTYLLLILCIEGYYWLFLVKQVGYIQNSLADFIVWPILNSFFALVYTTTVARVHQLKSRPQDQQKTRPTYSPRDEIKDNTWSNSLARYQSPQQTTKSPGHHRPEKFFGLSRPAHYRTYFPLDHHYLNNSQDPSVSSGSVRSVLFFPSLPHPRSPHYLPIWTRGCTIPPPLPWLSDLSPSH